MNILLSALIALQTYVAQPAANTDLVAKLQQPNATATQDDKIQFFRIGTGGSGGTYFIVGGILANAISNPPGSRPCSVGGSCGVKGLIAVAQSTAGSKDNIQQLQSGALQSAIVQEDIAKNVLKQNKNSNLRVITPLYPDLLHIVVRDDSNIKSLQDIAGQKVSLGQQDSGTASTTLSLLKNQNIRIKPTYTSPETAAANLYEGSTDVFVLLGGYPVPIIRTLAELKPVRLIEVPVSGYKSAIIPANSYHNVPETRTMQVMAMLMTTENQPDELIYNITKAFWNPASLKLMTLGHPTGKRISLDSVIERLALNTQLPLHPGAARYYREVSIKKLTDKQ